MLKHVISLDNMSLSARFNAISFLIDEIKLGSKGTNIKLNHDVSQLKILLKYY